MMHGVLLTRCCWLSSLCWGGIACWTIGK